MQPAQPHDDNSKLDGLVAQYLEAVERGEQPDRKQFLQQYPDIAIELQAFFADLDKVEATKLQARQAPDVTFIQQHEPKPGTIFGGRYKLLENIGEGGMGSVWVAEQQQPVKRRVAIKLVKAGMDSKLVLARFEAERQALAVMDHPNIAKVFDGGMTELGRPYFVMEYVKGVPFTEYCDKARLSLRERLNLFIPVCQAVQHAHHKGIVHRDLKPSNILICLYDGKPVPKVIDFGLAKAMHQSLTDQSIYTGHGIMVGTPLYMSPEQAEHNNLDVDTRTDIYSLGVVLYELLVGTTPLERQQLQQAAFEEVLRLIKEVEPPRPSLRLSTSASLPSIAAQRSIDPKQLCRSVAGDLDWIVMKSLEKERSRRYDTANGLARDIERFLNDEAVEACPPSRAYRWKKFVRKNRARIIVASCLLLALLIGIAGTSWQSFRATRAEHVATRSKLEAVAALADVTRERDARNVALLSEAAQRDLAERQLIKGLLRPIGYSDEPNTAELRCFIDWSDIADARLKLRVLEVAFEDPETALRVARRAERSIQACVGLSLKRRDSVVKFVSARQRDATADPRQRAAACWMAMALNSPDMPALAECVNYLNHETESGLREFVGVVTRRAAADQAMISRRQLSNILTEGLWSLGDDDDRVAVCVGIIALTPDQISIAVNMLCAVIEDRSSPKDSAKRNAISELITLAHRMDRTQIDRSATALIGILQDVSYQCYSEADEYPRLLKAAVTGLVELAPQLESPQAINGWGALISLLRRSDVDDESALEVATDGLNALAARLDSTSTVSRWDELITTILDTADPDAVYAAGEGLRSLAARLEPSQITRGWETLISAMLHLEDAIVQHEVGDVLVALAHRLDATEAKLAANTLLALLNEDSTHDIFRRYEGLAFASLAPRLMKEEINNGWAAHFAVLEKSTDYYVLDSAGHAMAAIAGLLDEADVPASGTGLIELIKKSDHRGVRDAAWDALVGLAPRLPSDQIVWSSQAILDGFSGTLDLDQMAALDTRWNAMSRKLESAEIANYSDRLLTTLQTSKDWMVLSTAGKCFRRLASRIDPQRASHAADVIAVLFTESRDYDVLQTAGENLAVLCPQLNSAQRVRIAEIISKSYWLPARVEPLASITNLLEPDARDRISNQVLSIFLDLLATWEQYFDGKEGSPDIRLFRVVARSMSNPMFLAQDLSHPGCVGKPREWLLQRFEEIVLHDGQHVFLTLPESTNETQLSDQQPPKPETPPRRFHNMHDAAAWIQRNWPDFDLEATHPVTWRGER